MPPVILPAPSATKLAAAALCWAVESVFQPSSAVAKLPWKLALFGQLADEMTMLRLALAVSAGVSASLTVMVKLEVSTVVGVPEITPLAGFRLRPAGKLPLVTLQL